MGAAVRAEQVVFVVPCFDEAERLPIDSLGELLDGGAGLVLVDDGSTDGTGELLERWAAGRPCVTVLRLRRNGGKGEAVRAGLRVALERNPAWVGFADADFAAPSTELLRLWTLTGERTGVDVVIASRVAMLGRDIRRSGFRHYTGRVFATLASIVLGVPVYDTQCGAKLFRVSSTLGHALSEPFRSRWAFDVELLGRLLRSGTAVDAIWEEPLARWHDIDGSRRSVRSSVRSCAELLPIWLRLRRWT